MEKERQKKEERMLQLFLFLSLLGKPFVHSANFYQVSALHKEVPGWGDGSKRN